MVLFRRRASAEPSQGGAGIFLGVSVSSSVLVLSSRPVLSTTCTSNFSVYCFINNKSKMKCKTQLSNFLSAEELFLQTRSDQKIQSVREPNEGGSGPSGVRCQVRWPPSSCQGRWPQGARTPGSRAAARCRSHRQGCNGHTWKTAPALTERAPRTRPCTLPSELPPSPDCFPPTCLSNQGTHNITIQVKWQLNVD